MKDIQKSIMEMARGAFLERVDYEMVKVLDNILDANTVADKKRKLTVSIVFTPDNDRQNIGVAFEVKSSLVPAAPAVTSLYVAGESSTGEVQVVEMVPQVPGQMSLDGQEQEAPATLKLVKMA